MSRVSSDLDWCQRILSRSATHSRPLPGTPAKMVSSKAPPFVGLAAALGVLGAMTTPQRG